MSSIVIQGDTSGSITVEAPSVAGTHTLTLPKATGNIATDATVGLGMKNRVINGDMRIAQRGTGTVNPNGSYTYSVDRTSVYAPSSGTVTAGQSTTAPDNFTNSLLVTSTTSTSIIAGNVNGVSHRIEGNNIADLGWGTAAAKTVTLSFWVRSSLTGTFGGAFKNSANNRAYVFEYTISAANTWEKKTITVAGDTGGTWNTSNDVGIHIFWSLGTGSTYSGTAGSWGATNYFSATGSVVLVATSGATFYITGVQLEVGENATPFENRMYGTELALCQRYFERKSYINGQTVAIVSGEHATYGSGLLTYEYKRTNATLSSSAASTFALTTSSSYNRNCTAVSFYNKGTHSCMIEPVIAESEFGDGACRMLYGTGGSTYIDISAEL